MKLVLVDGRDDISSKAQAAEKWRKEMNADFSLNHD
jgi:surfactin synthase thioesterase subunit